MSTAACKPIVEKFTVSLRQHTWVGRRTEVVESIRQLPGVFRVRASAKTHVLHIWVKQLPAGLLYRMAAALESCGCKIATGDAPPYPVEWTRRLG